MNDRVVTAVVPCAGLGTRMLPLTRAVPKALLPFADGTMIDQVIRELGYAGIEEVVLIIRPGDTLLLRHLTGGSDKPFFPATVDVSWGGAEMRFRFVEQGQVPGLTGALASAAEFVSEKPVVLVFPDQFLWGASATAQLLSYYSGQDSLSSMVTVSSRELRFFPGAASFDLEGSGPCYKFNGFNIGSTYIKARRELRGFGRTVLKGKFFKYLRERKYEQYPTIFAAWTDQGRHEVCVLKGKPLDLGTLDGYRYFWSTCSGFKITPLEVVV